MKLESAVWLLVSVSCLGALELSCSSDPDGGPAKGGSPNGGAMSATGGSGAGKSGDSGVNTGGGSGKNVDCAALCARVKSLCADNATISDVWLDACKSACDARAQLTPDVAQLEQTCVNAAADCSAAISCVASPH